MPAVPGSYYIDKERIYHMKKENRKLAQQRRAEARRREASRRRIKKVLMAAIPVAAIIAIVLAAVQFSSGASGTSDSSSTAGSASSSGAGTDSGTSAFSSDESLTVADGDTVNIDYVGTVDGVEFEGGNTKGRGTDLTIGSGRYIDDFEEQLIGHHPGETVEVNVTFPENYGKEELNGKDAVFTVTINGIYTGTGS